MNISTSSTGPAEPSMSPDSIPDLDEIILNVIDMVEYMSLPEISQLNITNKKVHDDMVYFKYREIISPKIINILLEDINNLTGILEMFETLAKIKCGTLNIEEETDKFAEKVENTYIYPKFGGKEKFFQMLKNNAETNKKNQ